MLQQILVVKEMCSYIIFVLPSSRSCNFMYKWTLSMCKGDRHGSSCLNKLYTLNTFFLPVLVQTHVTSWPDNYKRLFSLFSTPIQIQFHYLSWCHSFVLKIFSNNKKVLQPKLLCMAQPGLSTWIQSTFSDWSLVISQIMFPILCTQKLTKLDSRQSCIVFLYLHESAYNILV